MRRRGLWTPGISAVWQNCFTARAGGQKRTPERKNEEKLSRTQELNTAKVQALRELGYTEINERNASEVFDKIAEIQSRNNKY